MRHDLEGNASEIKKREDEIQLHQAAPLPESDLQSFFAEYVDAVAARGEKALAAHLGSAVYPYRAGLPVVHEKVLPLSFSEIGEVLGNDGRAGAGWLVDHFPLPLPYLNAAGDSEHGREILTFIFADQIKAAIARLGEKNLLRYRRTESCGLSLTLRRQRLAVLDSELAALRKEKAGIEASISTLKRGVA